jgi:hypothetical protein
VRRKTTRTKTQTSRKFWRMATRHILQTSSACRPPLSVALCVGSTRESGAHDRRSLWLCVSGARERVARTIAALCGSSEEEDEIEVEVEEEGEEEEGEEEEDENKDPNIA